jgi:D-inositol-3-phosphate glycosyltransferase
VSIRVALVSLHTSPLAAPGEGDAGGMNVYLLSLAEALAARGVDVELITRADAPDAPRALHTPGGVPVRFIEAGPRASVAKHDLLPLAAEFGAELARLPRFDVIHSSYWLSGVAALPVAEAMGIPHLISLQTVAAVKNAHLAPGDAPEPPERLRAEAELVHGSALAITLTEAERAAIIEAYDADASRIVVVTPGVDTTLFHPAAAFHRQAPPGPKEDARPTLLVLARIQPLKGVELAIQSLLAIPAARRPRLVIAGGTSPGHDAYASELRTHVARAGLGDEVTFLPPQSRPAAAELMRTASLVLVPSHSETFGLVALEAAASGTPVIAGRTTGLTESVVDGVTGVLVEGRDPDAWARAIDGLLSDRARLATLGASAAAYGRALTWERTARHLSSLYEQALVHG